MELHFNREQQARTHTALLDALGPDITPAQRAYAELFSFKFSLQNDLNIGTACELADVVGVYIFDQKLSGSHKYAIFDLPSLTKAVSSKPLAIFSLRLCNVENRENKRGDSVWTDAPADQSLPSFEIKFPEDIREMYE